MGKQRRKFSADFKRQVVQAVEAGMSINEAARSYQISPSVIVQWRDHYRQGTLVDKPTAEVKALRKENQQLKAKIGEMLMEMEHLKKMDLWIRRRKKLDTSVITAKNLEEFQKDAES
jgi:transposase-like protein